MNGVRTALAELVDDLGGRGTGPAGGQEAA
jgi:hypothetical protein